MHRATAPQEASNKSLAPLGRCARLAATPFAYTEMIRQEYKVSECG